MGLSPTSRGPPAAALECGQCFQWKRVGPDRWLGVVAGEAWLLRQGPRGTQARRVCGPGGPASLEGLLGHLNAGPSAPSLARLRAEWAARDEGAATAARALPGLRVLRLDPVEALFSFICSSNNNVARITLMVDRLRAALGEPLAGGSPLPAGLCAEDVPRQHALEFNQRGALHRFPAVEALAGASAEELLSLGLGYRARFVRGAARQLREGGGRAWLEALAAPACGRATAEAELRRLPGVGPKVAACVALLGLGHADAVPVDVHVARLAARSLAPPPLAQRLRGGALTPRVHAEVGELFRERYGAFAGWAQTLLFAAERERARPARR